MSASSFGVEFRATKDLDIILCVELLDANFVKAFWQFVRDGNYEIQEKASGEKQFYRFMKPKTDLGSFLEPMPAETLNLKAMGLGSQTLESVTAELRRIYGLGI